MLERSRKPLPPQRPPRPQFNKNKKRKRPVDDNGEPKTSQANSVPVADPSVPKKPKEKKPKNKKPKPNGSSNDDDLDIDLGLNRSVARMDRHLLADQLERQTRRFGTKLTPIELADLHIGSSAILDTSTYDKDRTLANLPDFLETFCAGGKKLLANAPKANGAPHTIVVTGAGLRAADLVRALRPFQTTNSTVSKLFAKHIKIAEAISFLQSHRTGIAVGTPARLIDLLEDGSLSVAHLRRLVVDVSHIDQKKRGVLDMQDTALPVARWLARKEFKGRYDADAAEKLGVAGEKAESTEGEEEHKSGPPLSILFY